ncbi:hypothetical protein niasHT_039978 [Heterodera trifolii]|uniref:Uncharacterized protein n=1 Tax=Heterodera trifolii TaxID=157864 RepID=A0ABD2J5U3_9BILA
MNSKTAENPKASSLIMRLHPCAKSGGYKIVQSVNVRPNGKSKKINRPKKNAIGKENIDPNGNANRSSTDTMARSILKEFWYAANRDKNAIINGWTTARALVDQFLMVYPPCAEMRPKEPQMRKLLLGFAESQLSYLEAGKKPDQKHTAKMKEFDEGKRRPNHQQN